MENDADNDLQCDTAHSTTGLTDCQFACEEGGAIDQAAIAREAINLPPGVSGDARQSPAGGTLRQGVERGHLDVN
jgi:hypothetical protein